MLKFDIRDSVAGKIATGRTKELISKKSFADRAISAFAKGQRKNALEICKDILDPDSKSSLFRTIDDVSSFSKSDKKISIYLVEWVAEDEKDMSVIEKLAKKCISALNKEGSKQTPKIKYKMVGDVTRGAICGEYTESDSTNESTILYEGKVTLL